ncbi:hypothetical protein [Nonomuraea salmonea]|uniref:Uncharacterized protein n=1 Tax=Nonomuraea salmonea TaxID=46181 RepID=A0ABV5NV30_9ACTN
MEKVETAETEGPSSQGRKPVSTVVRVVSAVGLYGLFILVLFALYKVVAQARGDAEMTVLSDVVGFSLCPGLSMLALAFVVERVSYRLRDVFMLLIPGYGLIWAGVIMWRLAYLPHRDWPERAPQPRRSARSSR